MAKELIDVNELFEAHKAEQAQLKKDWLHQVRAENGTFGSHQADVTDIEGKDAPADSSTPLEADSQVEESKVENIRLDPLTWRPVGQEPILITDIAANQTQTNHLDIAEQAPAGK